MPRVRISLTRTKSAHMPPVCIICGAPVDAHVSRTFSWRPQLFSVGFWLCLFLCFPAALLILLIGWLSTRRVIVECPVCDRHKGYWAWRGFMTAAPLLVITAADVVLAVLLLMRAVPDEVFGFMLFGTAVLLLAWAVMAAILQRTSLRADEITQDDVALAPVSAVFADLMRYERTQRRTAPDYGWEDYDPYPRRPLPTVPPAMP